MPQLRPPLLDRVLDVLEHPSTRQKLQRLADEAGDDPLLLCQQQYLPYVLDLVARVVVKFGFLESFDGITASLRALATVAAGEELSNARSLSDKLVALRRVLTPTGAWIKEDAVAEAEDLRKKKEDEQRRARDEEEARRAQAIAAENARRARLRAKKMGLGLDPDVPRLPEIECTLPRVLCLAENERVVLRVGARFVTGVEWFFNGQALFRSQPTDQLAPDVVTRGRYPGTIVVSRVTRRTVGDYHFRREPWRLALSFPAHRTAFETSGFALAVAQGTALKTWISIVDPLATTPLKSSTTRFLAHVGKVSALEWTSWTSLLVSAGHDGYVKVWAIEPQAHCVYRVHLDWQGIRSMALVERSSEEETNGPQTQTLLVTVSFSSVLETRELVGMHAFEATRRMKLDLHATQIQRIWKGRHTRELIAKYIKEDT
ncbi:hypothetical protein ATCC90586_006350 [Pythium insidiosum]|nr:hypothetical protein ATCC90586_006350 [Pythium insidiosum]